MSSNLGLRLEECCRALLGVKEKSVTEVFGTPDDKKLRSSMTLSAAALQLGSVFEQVLIRFFRGEKDEKTVTLMKHKELSTVLSCEYIELSYNC
ncbi:MAG: DUF1810 family protein [Candidatus Hadarchaeum sp.]